MTPVIFKTNIDCCKKFMSDNKGFMNDINPMIGDLVRVYESSDKSFEVVMKVSERYWLRTTDGKTERVRSD